MPDSNPKPEREPINPSELEQLIELELAQKRAERARAKSRVGGLRAASFLFLFLVIAGALIGFMFFFSPDRLNELRAARAAASPSATPSPTVAPR